MGLGCFVQAGAAMITDHHPRRNFKKGSSDERATPQDFFDKCHTEFHFTVDAAANKRNAKLDRFWDKRANGLKQSWAGERVWCNPPYSRGNLEPWVEKAALFEAKVAVLLVPVWTDRKWFQEVFNCPHPEWQALGSSGLVRFLPGRLKFGMPGKKKQETSGAPFPCMLLIFFGGQQ